MQRPLVSLCFGLLLLSSPYLAGANTVSNSNHRAASPFPVPAGLEPAVEFWVKVFSEYGASQLIYFDPLDMGRIYEINDVGEENRTNEYINGERARIAAANGVDIERVKAQRGIKERTAAGIRRSGRYISQIQQIFKDRGLPHELTYLPIVESSYEIGARSSVGALGIWQFMPRTGREYMRVNSSVDERRDPIESSRAAASYLKQAYEYLGSWPLAITSYNFGQAGMARAVAEVGSTNLVDLIEKYNHPHWGFPPKQFYAEFLAAVEVGTNLPTYFPGLELDTGVELKEVEVERGTSLASLIKSSGLGRDEFLGWNPALSPSARLVPAGYRMKLPSDRGVQPLVVLAKSESVAPKSTRKDSVEPKPRAQVVHHKVKHGDTLYEIARRYGASVQRIIQVNGLRQSRLLRVGSTLRIPQA
ncbi:MAG TPA: transglycosylase SLT domain-containing protein [Candidatus Binatia bacterium]|nr:transglycosylase SLT domain-containing protein [Candidatus Binatia bacterium]